MSSREAADWSWQPVPNRVRGFDTLRIVAGHPEWYFRRGRFDAADALSHIAAEARQSGARNVKVDRHGDWLGVGAEIDWLYGDLASFYRLVSYKEAGRNSARAEVALTAFCVAVVTCDPSGCYGIKLTGQGRSWVEHGSQLLAALSTEAGRTIVFLPPA